MLTVEALLCEEARLWKESSVVMDEPRCEFAEWKDWLLAGDDIRLVFEFSGVFFFCMPSYYAWDRVSHYDVSTFIHTSHVT